MKDFGSFLHYYRGAIIGVIISIIVICSDFLKLAIGIIVFFAGVFIGNYIQNNKYEVKQKLLDFINRM